MSASIIPPPPPQPMPPPGQQRRPSPEFVQLPPPGQQRRPSPEFFQLPPQGRPEPQRTPSEVINVTNQFRDLGMGQKNENRRASVAFAPDDKERDRDRRRTTALPPRVSSGGPVIAKDGAPCIFEGWTISKAPDPKGQEAKWTRCVRSLMNADHSELRTYVSKSKERQQGIQGLEQYKRLDPTKQAQIDRLIEDRKKEDRDPNVQWGYGLVEQETRDAKKNGKRVLELRAINVILRKKLPLDTEFPRGVPGVQTKLSNSVADLLEKKDDKSKDKDKDKKDPVTIPGATVTHPDGRRFFIGQDGKPIPIDHQGRPVVIAPGDPQGGQQGHQQGNPPQGRPPMDHGPAIHQGGPPGQPGPTRNGPQPGGQMPGPHPGGQQLPPNLAALLGGAGRGGPGGQGAPGHGPPGHGPPGHGAPGHGAPGHGAPGHVPPGHGPPGGRGPPAGVQIIDNMAPGPPPPPMHGRKSHDNLDKLPHIQTSGPFMDGPKSANRAKPPMVHNHSAKGRGMNEWLNKGYRPESSEEDDDDSLFLEGDEGSSLTEEMEPLSDDGSDFHDKAIPRRGSLPPKGRDPTARSRREGPVYREHRRAPSNTASDRPRRPASVYTREEADIIPERSRFPRAPQGRPERRRSVAYPAVPTPRRLTFGEPRFDDTGPLSRRTSISPQSRPYSTNLPVAPAPPIDYEYEVQKEARQYQRDMENRQRLDALEHEVQRTQSEINRHKYEALDRQRMEEEMMRQDRLRDRDFWMMDARDHRDYGVARDLRDLRDLRDPIGPLSAGPPSYRQLGAGYNRRYFF